MFKKFIALFGAQDMTVGRPFICLLKFSVPLLIGNIAQMLYTTVDSIVVGSYIGDAALSAIGVSAPIQNMFLVVFMAIGSGVTIMVSQYFGAKEYENLGDSIGNSITLIALMSILITAIATPLTASMLRLINTPAETFEMARVYMMVLFLGSAGNGFYNVLSSILRGLGESVFPLLVLLGTVILNVFLDIWFIAGLNMGIAGAAWATVISQVLSSVICLVKIMTMRKIVIIRKSMLTLKKRIVGHIVRLGVPTGLSMGIMFLGITIIQGLVNSMGFMVTAAITATIRLDGFAVLPAQTFSMAAATFTGQNIGAGKLDRVRQGSNTVFLMCLVFTVTMVTAMLLFGQHLLRLFTDTQQLIDMGMGFIRIMTVAYIAMTINTCFSGVMRGAGDSMTPMWISMFVNVMLRIPLSYLTASLTKSQEWPNGNPDSIFYSLAIGMIVGAILTMIFYRRGKWRDKAIVDVRSSIPEGTAS
jgi:putative MATE family efflux protein